MSFLNPNSFFRKTHVVFACACISVSVCATSEAYSPPPFGHYQPILDRMPFGAASPTVNVAPVDPETLKNEAQVKAEQQTLAKKVNMSAVNVTPDGQTAIGFTDLSQTPPVNFYLLVGSVAGGWTVKTADYDTETATLEKEGIAITLKLGQGLVDAPGVPTAKGAFPQSAAPVSAQPAAAALPKSLPPTFGASGIRPLIPGGGKPSAAQAVTAKTGSERADTRSYVERLNERKSQQTAALLASETKQREQLEALAREAAANEIRRREDRIAQAQEDAQAQAQPAPEAETQAPAAEPQINQ